MMVGDRMQRKKKSLNIRKLSSDDAKKDGQSLDRRTKEGFEFGRRVKADVFEEFVDQWAEFMFDVGVHLSLGIASPGDRFVRGS
jgi:hypothetical protein